MPVYKFFEPAKKECAKEVTKEPKFDEPNLKTLERSRSRKKIVTDTEEALVLARANSFKAKKVPDFSD